MKDLTRDEMTDVLMHMPDGVLAMSGETGPYCLPFGFVYIDGVIYLSMFPSGRKWECITGSDRVCFTAYRWNEDRTAWASVVVDGRLEEVRDMETIREVARANMVKKGRDPEEYLAKRMDFYEKALADPRGLKIFRLVISGMGGKTMHAMI